MAAVRPPRRCVLVTVLLLAVAACTACTADPGPDRTATSDAGASATVTATGAGPTRAEGTATPPADGPVTAPTVAGLPDAAAAVMATPPYASGQWALSVRDLNTGEQVIDLNAHTLFQPGSVVKTYSTGAAWQEFGPGSTVVTPVKRTGEIVDGTLDGDLILVGMGDLTLGGRTRPDGTVDFTDLDHNDANGIPGATLTPEDPLTGLDDLAAQVRAAGVETVSGDVIVDDRLWEPHALENGPVSPIVVNQNVLDLTTTPAAVGEVAASELRPRVSPWAVESRVRTVAAGGSTAITVSSPDERTVVLTGTIAADSPPVVNIHAFADPARFARTAFIEALQRAGVAVTTDPLAPNPGGDLPPVAAVTALAPVAELTSLTFEQEARYVLKISYNLGAETFVCRLAVAAGSTTCSDGLARAAGIWSAAGLDPKGAVLIDGSGLPGNLITADNQVELQTIMASRPDAAAWRSAMPALGVDGSLALVQKDSPARGKVVGKTGTLGAEDLFNQRFLLPSKALGGYIDTAGGRRFAFAVIATDSVFADIQGVFAANDDVGRVVAAIQQAY
ncbi:D-alanyl-D-alanine carboxypeptidase/D-alanyl-D-alanine-endopeptidase [Nakamurella deserti]|uniref:D-alanyl-D-alanine carboxypeptidase/D-alanyl-D-alanine endopeptidase n=1 Tax=Nakamurella deserti TaxID=2164074 RepID=UPI000DBE6255|nr:D-alanyl-D-alanine carboxypeptidase/D-alanyl-D-alanine-endopeptidase [Nakamurella deserti]